MFDQFLHTFKFTLLFVQELLNEQNKKQVTLSPCARLGQLAANVAVTALVLALIAGAQFALWLLLALRPALPHWELFVSFVVTAVVTLCPLFFHVIVKYVIILTFIIF